jgi:hypothetical protein
MMDTIHSLVAIGITIAGLIQLAAGMIRHDFQMETRGLLYLAIAGIWGLA